MAYIQEYPAQECNPIPRGMYKISKPVYCYG